MYTPRTEINNFLPHASVGGGEDDKTQQSPFCFLMWYLELDSFFFQILINRQRFSEVSTVPSATIKQLSWPFQGPMYNHPR